MGEGVGEPPRSAGVWVCEWVEGRVEVEVARRRRRRGFTMVGRCEGGLGAPTEATRY